MIAAMKAKDQLRVDTLRGSMAAFTNELVAKGRKPTEALSDEEAVAVLKRLARQRVDAAEQYARGGRQDLADKETAEKKILEEFLPKVASREEIEKVAREKISSIDKGDKAAVGKLIGTVLKEFAGRAEGSEVKAVVQQLLS